MKLYGVMLGSEKPKELAEFYQKVCGKTIMEDGNWYGFDIGGGYLMIGPHSEVKGNNQDAARIMISIESNEIQEDFATLTQAGAKTIAEPYQPDQDHSPDMWLATVADPEGNYLQLSTPWEM